MRRVTILLVLTVLTLSGCGASDKVDKVVRDAKREVNKGIDKVKAAGQALGAEAERIRDRIEEEVNGVLADIEGVLPRADEDTVVPQSIRSSSFQSFLGDVLRNVDGYWSKTFAANGIRKPRVDFRTIGPGGIAKTKCQGVADDQAAFYCPADDTIYLGEGIGKAILNNIGDFGVAYVVAHEYAHNVQQELGWYDRGLRFTTVAPFELQADCMAGAWGYAVYQQGKLSDTDVQEAVQTAYAVGDFDLTNPQHHGTPDERTAAWTRGYRTGDPSSCTRFLKRGT